MRIVNVVSYREFKEAGVNPHRTTKNPWNYLLVREDGLYGFSLNKEEPTTWTEPCESKGCKDGFHTGACIQEYRRKLSMN